MKKYTLNPMAVIIRSYNIKSMSYKYLHRSCSIIIGLLTAIGSYAQIVNDGAVITIEAGALLYTEVDVQNINSGTIANSGTIEMQADLVNSATFTSLLGSKVVFSGSSDASVTLGGAILQEVEMKKSSADIMLSDDMAINGSLNFVNNDNQILIHSHDLHFGVDATVFNTDDNKYIVTNDVGRVIKAQLSSFTFSIGYDQSTYNPATIILNVPSDIGVRLLEHVYKEGLIEGTQVTQEALDATWDISGTVSAGASLSATLQWDSRDELSGFDRTQVVVSRHDGTSWTALLSDLGPASGDDPYVRTQAGFTELGAFTVAPRPLVVSNDSRIENSNYIRYYPNPTSDAVSLETNLDMEGFKVQLLDSFGRLMRSIVYTEGFNIDMSDYPQGVYILRLVDQDYVMLSSDRVVRL